VQPDIPPLSNHDDLGLLRKRGGQRDPGHGPNGSKTDMKRHNASHVASGETHFRVRPGRSQSGPPTWDPYAADQSSSHRVRQLRRGQSPRRHHGPDYYEILGVVASATTQEIEAAYRRAAARVHPDRYFADPDRRKEAEKALKRVNAAVQVLRDPARRARYDARRGFR
jgi:DnaJ-domain-containing protein 1